jgi:hypothetical protein
MYFTHRGELPVRKRSTCHLAVFSSGIQDIFVSVYIQMPALLAV